MYADFCHAGRIDLQSNPHISPVCLPDVFQVLEHQPYHNDNESNQLILINY